MALKVRSMVADERNAVQVEQQAAQLDDDLANGATAPFMITPSRGCTTFTAVLGSEKQDRR